LATPSYKSYDDEFHWADENDPVLAAEIKEYESREKHENNDSQTKEEFHRLYEGNVESRKQYRFANQDEGPPVLNIGSGAGHSLQQVVQLVEEAIGRPVRSITADARRADIPVSILDVTLAEQSIGFRAIVPLGDGLLRTLRHYGIDTPGSNGS